MTFRRGKTLPLLPFMKKRRTKYEKGKKCDDLRSENRIKNDGEKCQRKRGENIKNQPSQVIYETNIKDDDV